MAEAAGFTPPSMDWQAADLPDEFERFQQYCLLVFQGPFSDKSDKEKVAYVMLWIGRTGVDAFNSFEWDNASDKSKVAAVFKKFNKHLQPRVNARLARFELQKYRQQPDESVDDFFARCKKKTSKCKFRDAQETNDRLIEQLIVGTKHSKVQERLLEGGSDLTLDEALDKARTYEATQRHMEQLSTATSSSRLPETVHAISKSVGHADCGKCGRTHHPSKCPAHGSTCNKCGKANHWANVCRSQGRDEAHGRGQQRGRWRQRSPSPRERYPQRSPSPRRRFDALHFDAVIIDSVERHQPPLEREVFATLNVSLDNTNRPATLRAKVDTGAQGNILPLRVFCQMFPQHVGPNGYPKPKSVKPSSTTLTAYGGSKIKQCGTRPIPCSYDGKSQLADFYITDCPGTAIIGLPTATALQLVTLNCAVQEKPASIRDKDDLMKQYPKCFDGIGKFPGKYHITVDPNVVPVVHPPRHLHAIALRDEIKTELEDMIQNGIITKIQEGEPTAWVNSLVFRLKDNGKLRLCLDPKDLNHAILREHHVVSTIEEITPKLRGAKVFSIVDVKCGYWNVELDDESSYLTTFNTPFGRYRFLRMPFGLKMSQDVFQARIDQTFEGCSGVTGIADDIVTYGTSDEDHDLNMHQMMVRCEQSGLKLNPDKCRIKEDKIKFFGIICSADGIQPDPKKVSALKQMEHPENEDELQTFLGLVTYMSPFIPNASTLTAHLRELTKPDTPFAWTDSHQRTFDKVKAAISTEVTLSYFDPGKATTLQVDASMKGLGATLLQDDKPVAFASKKLTETESRYANIERELLAVVYGCERFHTYLFGQSFTVESDHKPLESIKLKHLRAAPPRLQRMLLKLQPYDMTIKYRPGKDIPIADALSRLSPEETEPIEDLDVSVHAVFPQFSDAAMTRIREESAKDAEMSALKEMIFSGWPSERSAVPAILLPYWNFRDEMSTEDGLVLKSSRVLIPPPMRGEILSKLHASHQGIEKTKLRARTSVFWKDINKDIEATVSSCTTCQRHQSSQAKEPLMQPDIPPRAWHTLGTDLFYLGGSEYLIAADYYSKYFITRKLPAGQATSRAIIQHLKEIFGEHGIPAVLKSDNGPQYSSHLFAEFAAEYGFRHSTSSPHHPQSNGFIESQVKIAKRALEKARESGTDPHLALLCIRATPVCQGLPSPAEMLFGRQVQDNLPRKHQRDTRDEAIRQKLEERQDQQKVHHDQRAQSLRPLVPGQHVGIRSPTTHLWEPGIVTQSVNGPRSYMVQPDHGTEVRRNRTHLRERRVHFPPDASLAGPQPSSDVPSPWSDVSQSQPPSPCDVSQPAEPATQLYRTRSGRAVAPRSILDV